MKVSDISIADYYSDGKLGLREILSISREGEVRYRIHAAKHEHDFTASQGQPTQVIGCESGMTLKSFAAWAKCRIPGSEGPRAVLAAKARRLKLSAGEAAFLAGMHARNPQLEAGDACPFTPKEARAAAGLSKKGLVEVLCENSASLTPLGVAYLTTPTPLG